MRYKLDADIGIKRFTILKVYIEKYECIVGKINKLQKAPENDFLVRLGQEYMYI